MDDAGRKIVKVLTDAGLQRNQARDHVTKFRKKFMDGTISPQEFHQKYGIPKGAKCLCGAPPLITCRIFYPLDEVVKRDAEFIGKQLAGGQAETFFKTLIQFKDGPYVRISTIYSCKQHEAELERAAAKAPSWAVVEFNRGPTPDRLVIAPNTDVR